MAHSDEYQKELALLHNKRKSFGISKNIPEIVKSLIEEKQLSSVLDYGAGKGNTSKAFLEQYPTIHVHSYDPATFPGPLPSKIDLIYSSDVLEHIEPDLIDETLEDLCSRAQKYQYHLIACHPAKKALSDGRNAHLIVEDPSWWKAKIKNLYGWNIVHEEIIEYTATVKKGPPIPVTKYVVLMERL
jgi:hypothetical protein